MKTAIEQVREALKAAHREAQESRQHFGSDIDRIYIASLVVQLSAALTALKSLEGQGPISVDERLPEDGKRILAFGRTKYAHKRGGFSGMLWETVTYFADEKAYVPSFQLNDELVDVTHWKELPSAPALAKSANP